LKELVAMIAAGSPRDEELPRTLAAIIGNCAVELETGELEQEAEDIYTKSIAVFPNFAGLRLQYADFLADAQRFEEAQKQLFRGKDLSPSDRRIRYIEAKITIGAGSDESEEFVSSLRQYFDEDPGNAVVAAAYLRSLKASNGSLGEFEEACRKWEEAAPPSERWLARRALADRLAIEDDPDSERRAVEIYQSLLSDVREDTRADTLHNLATLHAALGAFDQAKRRWLEAYKLKPLDETIQLAFARHLIRAGEIQAAMKVTKGEQIEQADVKAWTSQSNQDERGTDRDRSESAEVKATVLKMEHFKHKSLKTEEHPDQTETKQAQDAKK